MNSEKFKYHYLRYNVHGVLRPNWMLKLSLLFLCRHILLIFFIGGMSFKGGPKPGMEYLVEWINPAYNITDILPAMLLYVMTRRRPAAKAPFRWLWNHGRQLILFSIVLFLVIFAFRTQFALSTYGAVEWVLIATNGLIAFYIGTSGFIRDLFNEFPEQPEPRLKASPDDESK